MKNKVIFLPYENIDDFYHCFVIAFFLRFHKDIEFVEYKKKLCFVGKYLGQETWIYLFKDPQIRDKSYYVFQRKKNKKDSKIVNTNKEFNEEYKRFEEDSYNYIFSNLFEGLKLADDIAEISPFLKTTAELKKEKVILYKYKAVERSEDNNYKERVQKLLDGNLTFCAPKSFNDPFDCDCDLPIDSKRYLFGEFWEAAKKSDLVVKENRFSKEDLFAEYDVILEDINEGWNSYNKALKELSDRYFDSEESGRIKEAVDSAVLKYESLKNDFRVLCMAKNPKDILMWGYYCNGGKGISVEFNQEKIISGVKTLSNSLILYGDVKYKGKNEMPTFRLAHNSSSYTVMRYIMECVFTKYNVWKHENERRFVLIGKNKDEFISFLAGRERCFLGVENSKIIMEEQDYLIENAVQLWKHPTEYSLI